MRNFIIVISIFSILFLSFSTIVEASFVSDGSSNVISLEKTSNNDIDDISYDNHCGGVCHIGSHLLGTVSYFSFDYRVMRDFKISLSDDIIKNLNYPPFQPPII